MAKKKPDLLALVLEKIEKLDSKLDEKMDKTHLQFDTVGERLGSIDLTLVRQAASLEEHMKRSDLLEASQGNLEDAIRPILKVYTIAWGIVKIVTAISVLVGIAEGIKQFL